MKLVEKYRIALIMLLPITTLIDAYKFFSIQSFAVTFSLVTFLTITILSFIYAFNKQIILKKWIICGCIFMSFICLNYLLTINKSFYSLMLVCFFIMGTLFTHHIIREDIFNKYSILLSKLITGISLYSIYQFFGRKLILPFSDLWFDGFMVEGFNWTNPVYFSGNPIYRANGIFKEPSFLSQYAALAILIIIINIMENNKNKMNFFMLIINIIAMILTMAGTGVIILCIGSVYVIIKMKKKKKLLRIALYSIILFVLIISIFDIKPIIEYMFSRINEVKYGTNSGGARFTLGFKILIESLKVSPFIGNGIGGVSSFLANLNFQNRATADNNITRIGVELGIIGLVLWTLFQLALINKNNIKNHYYNIFLIFILVNNITGDNFLSMHIWAFIYYINVNIVPENNNDKEGVKYDSSFIS